MKTSNLRLQDRTYFLTRSSVFMPILFITQMNVGIYMVFGGPAINRTFDVRASVLITRQAICVMILLILAIMSRKINFKVTTLKDWKYTILCGK